MNRDWDPSIAALPADAEVRDMIRDLEPTLLTHDEAHLAGEAMFDRAHIMAPELRLGLTRDDAAWADLARIAWDAVWSARRAETGRGVDAKEDAA